MNINVPTQINTDIKNTQTQTDQAGMNPVDSLLFSLFLNNLMGMQAKAKGQTVEGTLADSLNPNQSEDGNENLLEQNMYLQILQSILPAGKEANPGSFNGQDSNSVSSVLMNSLGGVGDQSHLQNLLQNQPIEENLNQFPLNTMHTMQLSSDTGKEKLDFVTFMKDMGFEWSTNSISGETRSLNPTEMAQYIKISEQLQALSGKIEQVKPQGTVSMDVLGNTPVFTPKQVIDDQSGVTSHTATNPSTMVPDGAKISGLGSTGQQGSEFQQNQMEQNNSEQKSSEHPWNLSKDQKSLSSESKPTEQITMPNKTDDHSLQTLLTQTTEQKALDTTLNSQDLKGLNPDRIYHQVIDVLKMQDLKNKEVKELSIQLHPAELGKVQISMRLENGQVHLVVNASEQATGSLLQNHLSELKNGLTQMGVQCGSLEMGYQQDSHSDSNREFFNHPNYRSGNYQEEEKNSIVTYSSYLTAGSGSKLNVSA